MDRSITKIIPMFCDQRKVWYGQGSVRENVQLAEATYRLAVEISTSGEAFPEVHAGQFVMLRLAGRSDPLLGRPLAIYRLTRSKHSDNDSVLLEVVYIVVGKMTARLAGVRPNEILDIWGPLGQGFKVCPDEHTIMVAGGIGQTPFLMHAANLSQSSYPSKKTLLYGARSANRLACIEDFERTGIEVKIATDDGSRGYHGSVTDLIHEVYRAGEPTRLICCGPHPMLKAAFGIARTLGLPCEVSLETPMGCGLGICYGCVVRYRNEDEDHPQNRDYPSQEASNWDYKRTCIDGPAFDAYRLDWD